MEIDSVSVIVPVYNVAPYLEACVNSILNQTHKNLEVVLINDGSTDESGKICDDYKRKESRVKVIHKSNGGQAQARNRGLDIAKGDFISFIDSDDYVHKRFIEVLLYGLKKYDVDISYCNIDRNKNLTNEMVRWEILEFEEFYQPLKQAKIRHESVCNKLFKRSIWSSLWFDKGKMFEDIFIFHKLCYERRFAYTPNRLYYYRVRPGSIMKAPNEMDAVHLIQAQRKKIEVF